MRPELVNMKGGTKQFWLRVHRQEVESFYFEHGAEATMKEFNLMPATLDRFWSRKNEDIRQNRLSKNDRWVYGAAMESVREVKHRVAKLEAWREEVTPIIELGQALVNATVGSITSNVASPALPDGVLSLDNNGAKLKK